MELKEITPKLSDKQQIRLKNIKIKIILISRSSKLRDHLVQLLLVQKTETSTQRKSGLGQGHKMVRGLEARYPGSTEVPMIQPATLLHLVN